MAFVQESGVAGGGNASPYSASIGSFSQNVDVYSASLNGGTHRVSLSGKSLTISGNGSAGDVYKISDAKIKVNGTTFIKIDFSKKYWALFQSDSWSSFIYLRGNGSRTIPLNGTTSRTLLYSESGNYTSGTDYYYTISQFDNTPNLTSSGTYTVTLEIKINDTTYNISLGTITAKNPIIQSISLGGSYSTKFYKNATFSHSGQTVTAYYKYAVAGTNSSGVNVTSGATWSGYNMASVGGQTVTVSYGGKSATYNIQVVGITSVGFSGIRWNYRYLVDTNPDTPTSVDITYSDGTSRSVAPTNCSFQWTSGNMNSTGNKVWYTSFYDSYTKETITWAGCSFGVYDVSSIALSGNFKKTYKTNESISTTNMVVTATYGSAGTSTIAVSNCEITGFDTSAVASSKTITVKYRGKTATYSIKVDGITDVRLYVPDAIKKFIKGETFSISGLKVYYTRSDQAETEIEQGNWDSTNPDNPTVTFDSSNVNMGVVGEYTVSVTVTYKGNSITKTYSINVIALESLSVSDYTSKFIKVGSTNPTFSTGALSVTGHFSDGTQRALSSNEYTVSAPSDMGVGTHSVTVSSTIGSTVSTTYTITVIDDYPVTITSVDITSWTGIFTAGQTFSKTGIIVKATMASGLLNQEVDFSTSLDGEIFGSDITSATTNFTLSIPTDDPENPLEIDYDDGIILNDGEEATLTVKYDKLNSISVSAGNQTSALRWVRAGDEFTDWISDSNHIVVKATYEYSGEITLNRTDYTLSKEPGTKWTKDDMGDNTITVSFGGKTDTYTVRISILFDIVVTTSRNPNQYNRYEQLNTSELTVKRRYTYDGENAEVGGANVDISKCSLSGCYNQLVPDNEDELTTDIVITYEEAGVSKSDTLTITVKQLISVELDVEKISVNYGENVSFVGRVLTATFNTEDVSSLTIGAGNTVTIDGVQQTLTFSGLDSTIIKNKVAGVAIGLTFGSETVYATVDIHCIYLGKIELDVSYYSEQTLYAGETLSLEHISVTAYTYSTDDEDENYPATEVLDNDATGLSFNISEGQVLVAGSNTVSAQYIIGVGNTEQMKTDSETITALEIALSSISVDDDALEKALDSYVEGQNLNLTGLVVSAAFNRSASDRDLELNECKFYIDTTEVSPTKALSTSDNGKTLKVAFTYDGVTKEATIGTLTVVARALTSIAVKTGSSQKTAFLYGDKFEHDGLIITATYNDGYSEDITTGFTTSLDAFKTTPFTSSQSSTTSCTVYLEYAGTTRTCTYSVTVSAPALDSLRFDTSFIPLSVTNGTSFSFTGLIVYAVFENGYEEQLTMTTDWVVSTDLSRDGSNNVSYASNNLGVKTAVITGTNPYDNTDSKTANLNITVTPNLQLVDIRLKWKDANDNPDNGEYASEYRVGDTFNAKGLIVEALFKDTDWMEVVGWETSNPTLGTLLRYGGRLTVTVSYTNQGTQLTATYPITVLMPYDSGLVEENTYKVAFNVTSITHEEATIEFSPTTQLPLFRASQVDVDTAVGSPTNGLNVYTGLNASNDCIGYIKLGDTSEIDGSVIENGQVVLFDDPVNPIDGQGNIVVKFPHYVDGYADRVNNCHFGIIYNKRLFVSGNSGFPNMDWHSSQVNSAQAENYKTEEDKDLTYFSDLDYCKYGSEISAVKGYDIYRDGTLLVFKEKTNHEATIYTRTTQLVNASSYDGTVVNEGQLAEEAYPCFEVNPNGGSGAISPDSIINFVGETLVLTRDGLKAITSKEITYNNAKYSYDVSSHINNHLLKNNDLGKAFVSQFKEKLLLKTDEGLYVGEYALRDEKSEYEWYFCDNIDAYYFFELDDELYFSDNNGNINRFVENERIERKDKPRTYVGLGGTTLSIDANTDEIIVSSTYADEIKVGREFHLLSVISSITGEVTDESQIYANMGLFINKNLREYNIQNNVISFDQTAYAGLIDPDTNQIIIKPYNSQGNVDYERMTDIALFFYDGRAIYIDAITGVYPEVAVDRRYTLKRVQTIDMLEFVYQIVDEQGNVVELTGTNIMRLSFRVNELSVAYITDVSDYSGGKKFKVGVPLKADENGNVMVPLDLIYYNNRSTGTYKGVITDHVKVISYFIPKAFNLGHDLYQKSIYMWSIINDSSIPSMMNVGYIASRKYGDFKVAVKEVGGARQLSFSEGFNFDKIHWTNDKLPHIYNRNKILPRVGFIRFIFFNDEGTRMVLSKLEIIYAYSLLMKGVK